MAQRGSWPWQGGSPNGARWSRICFWPFSFAPSWPCSANGEIFSILAKFFLCALCASARFLSSPKKKVRAETRRARRGVREIKTLYHGSPSAAAATKPMKPKFRQSEAMTGTGIRGQNDWQGNERQRNISRVCLFPIPLPLIPLPLSFPHSPGESSPK